MAQQLAYSWLRETQPNGTDLSDDPFSDIPINGEPATPVAQNSQPVSIKPATPDDPFADIPIASTSPQNADTRPQYADTMAGSTEKYWDQFQAGMNDLAKSYYGNKARTKAEEYQNLVKQSEQQKAGKYPTTGGLLNLMVYPADLTPVSEIRQRKEELKAGISEDLIKAKDYQTAAQNMPQVKAVEDFLSKDDWNGWEDFKKDPVELGLGLTARSAPSSLISMGAGIVAGVVTGNRIGSMVGSGSVGGRIEYINSIMTGLDEKGIDWTNSDEFIKAVNDDELMESIKEEALKRSLIIGSFDGFAAYLGGSLLVARSMLAKSLLMSQITNLFTQGAAQAFLGAGGEAGAQLWAKGEIGDPRGVLAEGIGEGVLTVVEAPATLYAVTRGSKGIAKDRLKATNELIVNLNKKRQKAYKSGNIEDISKISEELNQFIGIRDALNTQLKMTDTETLMQSEQMIQEEINTIQGKLFSEQDQEERTRLNTQVQELERRKVQVGDAINSQPNTITTPLEIGREQALADVKRERAAYQQELRKQEEDAYQQRMNPMNAASDAQRKIAAEGGDALNQQLGAAGAYANARSLTEMAEESASRESAWNAQLEWQQQVEQLQEEINGSFSVRKIYLQKQLNNLLQKEPGQSGEPTGLLTTPSAAPNAQEEPYQPRNLNDVLREQQERMAQERDQQANQQSNAEEQQQREITWSMAEEQKQKQEKMENQIVALETHLMEVEKQEGEEAQRQADWDRAEIQRLQQEIQATVPVNPAMAKAMQQAQAGAAEKQAETQRRLERWDEYTLAEKQRYAHELIDEAVKTGEVGSLGEPLARAYADNGEIFPSLKEKLTQARNEEIEQGFQDQEAQRGEKVRTGDEINRLETHLGKQEAMEKAQQGWTSEQPVPGAIPQQQPTELTGLLNLQTTPETVSVSETPVEKTTEPVQEPVAPKAEPTESETPPQATPQEEAKSSSQETLPFDSQPKNEQDYRDTIEARNEHAIKVVDSLVIGDIIHLDDGIRRVVGVFRSSKGVVINILYESMDGDFKGIVQSKEPVDHFIANSYEDFNGNRKFGTTATVESDTQYTTKEQNEYIERIESTQGSKKPISKQNRLKELGLQDRYEVVQREDGLWYVQAKASTPQEGQKKTNAPKPKPIENPIYKAGQLRMMRNVGQPANDLAGNDTGWIISQSRHGVVLIHPDTDEYQLFPTKSARDSAERELVTIEAISWAEDNAIPQATPQEEAKSSPKEKSVTQEPKVYEDPNDDPIINLSNILSGDIETAIIRKRTFGEVDIKGTIHHDSIEDFEDGIFQLESLLHRLERKGELSTSVINSAVVIKAVDTHTAGELRKANLSGDLKPILERAISNLKSSLEKTNTKTTPKAKETQATQAQVTENFEQRLRDIGKEWIKDEQHRFYFNDIIKELAATSEDIPGNAKLWYDRKTQFYGHDNLDDAVFDKAVERLEALRSSLLEEVKPKPKPKSQTQAQPQQEDFKPSPVAGRSAGRKRKLIAIDDELSTAGDELAAVFKDQVGKVSSGVDPVMLAKVLQIGIKASSLYVQKGAIKFADWADNMLAMMESKGVSPTVVAPYLKQLYLATAGNEAISDAVVDQMEDARTVRAFDIKSLLETEETAAEVESKPTETKGLTIQSGRHEGEEYRRIGDMRKVAPSVTNVAALFVELQPGDLLIDKFGNENIIKQIRGGNITFKENSASEESSINVNDNVGKSDHKKLTLEIIALKHGKKEQVDKAPKETKPTKEPVSISSLNGSMESLKDEISKGLKHGLRYSDTYDSYWIEDRSNRKGAGWVVMQKPLDGGFPSSRAGAGAGVWDQDDAIENVLHSLNYAIEKQITEPETTTTTEPIETKEPIKQDEYVEYAEDYPSTTHTTKKDRILHGIIDTTLTKEQAKIIDPGSFKKDGGWFIREHRIGEYNDKVMAGTIQAVHPVKKPKAVSDETTERISDRILEGAPAGETSEVSGSRDTGEGSVDSTSEGSLPDIKLDGRGERTELRGSEEQSVLGTDIHSAGAVSDQETGRGGRGVLQGNDDLADDLADNVGSGREGGVNTGAADYTITEADDLEGGTFKQVEKFNHNLAAIRLLKELGDRPATKEQQAVFAQYVGWGGLKQAFYREDGTVPKGWEKRAAELKELLTPEEYTSARASTLNAHYTTPSIVNAIYAGLQKLGFTHGRVLEPSVGVGNFFGLMPKEMRSKSNLNGVELDNITGGIAQKLYGGNARITAPMGFENYDIAEGSYDLVIGNPPFGDETITDVRNRDITGLRIHNYFFAKSMKALRPGGVMAMVVSKGFMDSSKNQKGRESMFRQARLLGAYRLPNQAFKANANADVTTDIIFLQKRNEPLSSEAVASETTGLDYRNRAEFTGADGNVMSINQYFVSEPDNLMGDMIMNKGRFGPELEPAMTAREGFDWKAELDKRVDKMSGTYQPDRNVQPSSTIGVDDTSSDIKQAEVGGLYINDQGELFRRQSDLEGTTRGEPVTGYINDKGEEKSFGTKDIAKLQDAVSLARTARQLINMQVMAMTDAQLQPLREQLNQQYDAFIKKYQMLNRRNNKRLLNNGDLTTAPMLLALENGYKKEKTVSGKKVKETSKKADIFTLRTQEPYSEVTKVSSPDEALIVSLAQTGRVNIELMSQLYGKSKTEIVSKLTGQIYDDPQSGWVTKDEYLSGNVKLKLRQAKEAGRGFEDNVAALEKALPEDVAPADINVSMGASWQTSEVINDFYIHLGGSNPQTTFIPQRNYWSFKADKTDNPKKWSTEEMGMKDLFAALLNNKPIQVNRTDPITDKRVLNVRATDAATEKAKEIQNEFISWLWKDPQRREAMSRRYNDLINTNKTRQFDGSFLTFPGKISDSIIKLRSTQANAVWRILQSGSTLLDHVVGAGKTFTMIAAAMELKRTGLAKKPLIIVPNHLVAQWAEDFARLYPNAKVLAARKEDFNKHKRKEMLARIATGDWDAVIMAHTSFGKMPTDPETQSEFLNEQLRDLTTAIVAMKKSDGAKSRSVRDAENQKKKLEEKLKELLDNTAKDNGMTWNETGIDALFVDEAHEFKNLQFYTGMNRVKNINPDGSQKAQDLFIKIRALLKKTKGRNLIFATGTPISNSMGELYTMQRYLGYEQLIGSGLNHFDAWARTFGMIDTRQERKSSGTFGPVSRFSKFVNLPELMTMYRQFADNINNDDIKAALAEEGKGVHIPKVKGGRPTPVVAPRSIYQEAYMGLIEERFANMPEDPSEDNPLKATNDARKAGLDMRMVFPELPDVKESKINRSIDNMMGIYHKWHDDKGTQLIFSDLSTPKSVQGKEIAAFRKLVEEAAASDDSGRNRKVKNLTVTELYTYLEDMAEAGNQKAISRLEKVSPDDIAGWTSKFDVYNDIKQKLISQGVPESEIVFIHQANTDLQKEELFAKVNSGEVRFLLGSTAKMGAGTNVQERLVALHHMDAPWRPSDLEQREGRIIRQGNSLFKRDPDGFEVEILRYATEQTYDVNMWQTLEIKARFIEQVRNGDTSQREAQDVAGESASAAEMKAASSGDPRIMEQVEIMTRLKLLDSLRSTHRRDKTNAVMEVERLKSRKNRLPSVINSYQADLNNIEPLQRGKPQLQTMEGDSFNKSKQAEDWLKQQVLTQAKDRESNLRMGWQLGTYRGMEVHGEISSSRAFGEVVDDITFKLVGEREYFILSLPVEDVAWGGVFTRFNNAIDAIKYDMENEQNYLDSIDLEIGTAAEQANSDYKYEDEYQTKNQRNQQLMEELGEDQKINQEAMGLPEYVALTAVMKDYQNKPQDDISSWLGNTAIANRAGKLASSIKHSKAGKQQEAADKAMRQAAEQEIPITQEDLKVARESLEAAREALRKAEQESKEGKQEASEQTTTQASETKTVEVEKAFTSAQDAIDFTLKKKKSVTADNSNIRLEKTSLGYWQMKVKEDPETNDFDDDSIIFDNTLIRFAGTSTRVGNEQVFTFQEDRLTNVVRYLYGKVGLSGMQTEVVSSAEPDMPVNFSRAYKVIEKTGDPLTKDKAIKIAYSFKKGLTLPSRSVKIEIYESIEDFYDKNPGYSEEHKEYIGNPTGFTLPYRPGQQGYKISPAAGWRVIGLADTHQTVREFQDTLRHEIIGHLGIDTLEKSDRDQLIKAISETRNLNLVPEADKQYFKSLWEYIDNLYDGHPEQEKAEEFITHTAHDMADAKTGTLAKLWNMLISAFKRNGLIKEPRKKQDIIDLLNELKRRVNKGTSFQYHTVVNSTGKLENIRFRRSDDSSSFTANSGEDQPSRLFNTQALAESQLIKNFTRTRSSLMVPIRKLMLPSMGLRQIVDTYARVFTPMAGETWKGTGVSKGNPLVKYQGYVQGMQSLKSNKLKEADDIDIEWGRLAKSHKQDYETLADIQHRSTLFEVFPDRKDFNEHEDMNKLILEIAQATGSPKIQSELRRRLMYERERKAEHKKLHELYQAMSTEAKSVYKKNEQYHSDMWDAQQKALEEKILRSINDTDSRQFFLRSLKKQFHDAKVRGPYFPLQRFGAFYVIAEDSKGEYYREHFETEAKLQKEKDVLQREGMTILSYGLAPDFTSRKLEGVSGFADQLHISLDSDKFANVSVKIKDEIRNEVNQLALQMMPDVSAAKHQIRRKKIKGFSDNARRAFAYNAIHSSNRLARTVYGDRMSIAMERIHDDIDAKNHQPYIEMKDRTIAAQVLSELEKQHETIMNPKGSPLAARITNLAFIWYLGASAGAGLVNLTQTPLIGIPLMGGRFGYRKTSVAMAKAAKDFALHGYNKISLRESVFTLSKSDTAVNANEKSMLEQLIDDGTIDTTQTSTLAQIADTDLKAEAQVKQDAWVKVNRLLGFFFHNAETANREITALATYRLAIAEGQNHQVATDQARKMVFDAHFDYSGANRPRVMKSDWVKVFTIFKQYSQNMTYTLIRNFVNSSPFNSLSAKEKKTARKALAGILFAHATVAGTLGLPLISMIGPVLAAAFGEDDDEFRDWNTMYRNWLADMFGKEAGHAMAKGVVNGFIGADLHSRTSINDLWVRSPNWEMSAREENMHYLTQAAGPAFGAGLNFMVGLDQMASGDWKGIEKMVPKFVRDGIRSYRYATEGATVGREGYQSVVEEFKPWELGMQAMGLTPARLGEAYQARSAVKNIQDRIQTKRQSLTADYARAIRTADYAAANQILMDITNFNITNPTFQITSKGLQSSLKARYRYEHQSQAGIYLPQAKLGLLREARFAL